MISNFDSVFVVWNTPISVGEQTPHDKESDSDEGSTTFNMCYMVQGDERLEENSDSEADDNNEVPYNDLALFCQKLLEK